MKVQEFQNIELTTSSLQKLHFKNDQKCPQVDDIQAVNLITRVMSYFAQYGDRTLQSCLYKFLVFVHLVDV